MIKLVKFSLINTNILNFSENWLASSFSEDGYSDVLLYIHLFWDDNINTERGCYTVMAMEEWCNWMAIRRRMHENDNDRGRASEKNHAFKLKNPTIVITRVVNETFRSKTETFVFSPRPRPRPSNIPPRPRHWKNRSRDRDVETETTTLLITKQCPAM